MKNYLRGGALAWAALLVGCGGSGTDNPDAVAALEVGAAGQNVEVISLDGDPAPLSMRSTGPVAAAAAVPRGKTALAAKAENTTVDVSRTMVTPSTSTPLTGGLVAGGTRTTGLIPASPDLAPVPMAWVARISSDGAVDSTFAGGGFTFLPDGHERAETTAVVVDSAGRTLVAAAARSTARPAYGSLYVLRLTSSGSLDSSFGNGGVVKIGTATYGPASRIKALAVQPSGRVLALGFTAGASAFDRSMFVAGFKTDGSVDTSFGSSGQTTLAIAAGRPDPIGIELMDDGRILIGANGITTASAGIAAGFDVYLARLTATGGLDNGFGSAGVARIRLPSAQARAVAVGLRSDGGAVVAGQATLAAGGTAEVFFAKLTSSGALDPAFGTAGIARISAAATDLDVRGAVLPRTGTLAAVARTQETDGERVAVFAVTSAGQPDASFAAGGRKLLDAAQFSGRKLISATPSTTRRSITLNTARLEPAPGTLPAPEFVTVNNVTREDTTPPPPCGTFVASGPSRGLEVRGGKPGAADWEWGLGYNTQSAGKFVAGQHTWASGQSVNYTLNFSPTGSASVSYGGQVLNYSAATGGPVTLGNAVKLYLKASGTTPASSVAATLTRINGFSLGSSLTTVPTATSFNDTSLIVYSSAVFSSGLQIDGSVRLNYVGTVPSGSRLGFVVQPGNYTACN